MNQLHAKPHHHLYGLRQKEIYKRFKLANIRGETNDFQEYRNSNEYKELLKSFRKGGDQYLKAYEKFHERNTSADNPDKDPAAGPSNKNPDYFEENIPEPDFNWNEFIDLFDPPAGDTPPQSEASGPNNMEVEESGSGRGPTTGARSVAPEGTTSRSGDGTSIPSPWFPKSTPSNNVNVKFSKSRILYSYGYSTQNLADPNNLQDNITTPLALIAVDFLPFYLSEAEWQSLPINATVEHVWCRIYPLGTRTAFDTGTTLSGSATSEYVPIGLKIIGMNKSFYGKNVKYRVDSTKPMVPTGLESINSTDIYRKYYDNVPSSALCVPRSISEYFVHTWNKSQNPDVNKHPDYQIHNSGVAQLDQKVDQFLINSLINQLIVDFPYTRKDFDVESHLYRARSHKIQFFNKANNAVDIGAIGLGSELKPFTLNTDVVNSYARQIENYGSYSLQYGSTDFHAQPQLRVGIQATPQLNPGNEQTNFLNSWVYWRIECGISINCGFSSAFTKEMPISWPTEVKFYNNKKHRYTDGQTLFGNTDAQSGNIESLREELDYIYVDNDMPIPTSYYHQKIKKSKLTM